MSNIPELRFKEFSGEWDTKPYGAIYKFYSTNSLSREKLNYQSGEVYNIHYGDIHTKFSTMFKLENENVPFINSDVDLSKIKEENYCQVGDLVVADASEDYADIGKTIEIISLNDKKTLAGLHTFLARPNNEYIALGFVGYMLQNYTVRKQIMKIAQGTKVLSLSTGRLSNIILNLPQKQEQQKIASFLTKIDTKIEQLTKKVELQEQYKKGVMQKIFSQEIRFKKDDESEFPKWEEMQLKDFLILTLREVPKPKENYLAIGVRSHCKGTFQRPNSEPHKIAMDKLYKVKENDLIVSITFAWESAIAIVKKSDEGGLVSHRFPTYTFKKDKVIVEFFRYVIIQKKFRFMLDLISPGGAGRNRVMSKKDFLKLKWALPYIEEQKKIANFLSTLDKQIDSTKEQLAKTKEFKKGLLQRMFV